MKNKKNSTNYENFEIAKISRTEIKEASYNPRIISSESQKKLKRNLKKVGLLQPLVVNKRTGNLVSGHQRLKLLDELNKELDYEMTIVHVDLDEKEEKAQNIFFNNANAMGEWNLPELSKLLPDLELEDTGFSLADLASLDIELSPLTFSQEEEEPAIAPDFSLKKPSMTKEECIAEKQRVQELSNKTNNMNYYLTVIFESAESLADFMESYDFNDKYVKAEEFVEKISNN